MLDSTRFQLLTGKTFNMMQTFKMTQNKTVAHLILIFVLAVVAVSSYAQSPEGALVGTVSDASNARIAGATVQLSAKAFSLTRSIRTNGSGEFRIESLPPGPYVITVEANGFATKTGSVEIAIAATAGIHVKLHPASIPQEVQVEGAGASLTNAPIETSSSVIKTTIGRQDLKISRWPAAASPTSPTWPR